MTRRIKKETEWLLWVSTSIYFSTIGSTRQRASLTTTSNQWGGTVPPLTLPPWKRVLTCLIVSIGKSISKSLTTSSIPEQAESSSTTISSRCWSSAKAARMPSWIKVDKCWQHDMHPRWLANQLRTGSICPIYCHQLPQSTLRTYSRSMKIRRTLNVGIYPYRGQRKRRRTQKPRKSCSTGSKRGGQRVTSSRIWCCPCWLADIGIKATKESKCTTSGKCQDTISQFNWRSL